ncbi:MAG: hypothetical protein EXR78_02935 [Deltaproteobacteria bacterium]|nr:hypothetical protein [Deltaproteobacteria bacterium]
MQDSYVAKGRGFFTTMTIALVLTVSGTQTVFAQHTKPSAGQDRELIKRLLLRIEQLEERVKTLEGQPAKQV